MDDGNSSPVVNNNGQRKRKRSPYGSDSGALLRNGHVTSESHCTPPSDPSSPVPQPANGLQLSHKRTKHQDPDVPAEPSAGQSDSQDKLPSDLSKLPPELWQRVFTFVPPLSLGRLLSVNRTFNSLLDPSKSLPQARTLQRGPLSLQGQDHIWSVARKLLIPSMPRPMSSIPELETWKLVRGHYCQFCGRKPTVTLPSFTSAPWSSGPGPENVRVIWPFAVRSCGSCLSTRLVKVGCDLVLMSRC